MGIDDHTLDVRQVGVVLQGSHVQPRLFAELRYAGAVIMRQSTVCHYSISYLRIGHQVDLQQLQMQEPST